MAYMDMAFPDEVVNAARAAFPCTARELLTVLTTNGIHDASEIEALIYQMRAAGHVIVANRGTYNLVEMGSPPMLKAEHRDATYTRTRLYRMAGEYNNPAYAQAYRIIQAELVKEDLAKSAARTAALQEQLNTLEAELLAS